VVASNSRSGHAVSAPEILVTWPDYDVADEAIGGGLTRAGYVLRLEPKHGNRTARQTARLAARASGAIVSTDPFDADVIAHCQALRVIARVGVGTDSVDLEAATEHGVAVTITPGANEATVADHAVGMMLSVLRRTVELDASIRRGEWLRTGPHTPWTLSGGTVGLVGYGRTGRLVAKRLAGFGVRILVNDVVDPSDPSVERVDLGQLLSGSDVVSLHVPLSDSTRGLIGLAELELMRRGAVLVNCARGGIVDESALIKALVRGRLRGAALDVFEEEPPRSPRLSRLANVVLSPHIAGLSEASIAEMTRRATASVIDVLSGRAPGDLANPDVLAHPKFGAPASLATARDHA
jgi:phosphoglycerate dehydrogenase-like enzyme